MPNLDSSDRYIVPALDRGLRLLALFTRDSAELTLAELTRRMELPHATVYRLAHTLERHNLLRRTNAGYVLSSGVLHLGFEYLSSQTLIEHAHAELELLRDDTGEAANLGVLDGYDAVYVAHVPSRRQLSVRTAVGSRFPAYASSIGQLLLGGMAAAERKRMFGGKKLNRYNADTPRSAEELERRIASLCRQGYAVSRGVYEENLAAVAAPIKDSSGAIVAAVNVIGASTMLDDDKLIRTVIGRVCLTALNVSKKLGYRGAT